MKKDIHPKYQEVLFVDTATGVRFVCGTTLQPADKEKFQGQEYPVYRVAISSASHPLYTGSSGLVDSEGRVDKFRKRYGGQSAQKAVAPVAAAHGDQGGEGQAKEQKKPAKPTAAPKKAAAKAPAKEKAPKK